MANIYNPPRFRGLPLSIYGNGGDGARTDSADATITTPLYLTNWTVDAGKVVTLEAPVFVSGTLTNNGTITAAGDNGENASVATGGFAGGSHGSTFIGGLYVGAADGANGGTGAGNTPETTNDTDRLVGGAGGAGGNGGLGSGGAGGAGGAAGTGGVTMRIEDPFFGLAGMVIGQSGEFAMSGAHGGAGAGGGGDGTATVPVPPPD